MAALVSLGANLADAKIRIAAAAAMIASDFGHDRVAFSPLLTTPPIGGPKGQLPFFNAVARLDVACDPFELWNHLSSIEEGLGRTRRVRWESRRIDLDVLLVDECRIWTPKFKLPHPRMVTRRFLLLPAAALAPRWTEPVSGLTLSELREQRGYAPAKILVAVDPRADVDRLRSQTLEQLHDRDQLRIRWLSWPLQESDPVNWLGRHAELAAIQLLIVAAYAPEPLMAAWEDTTREWAIALNLTDDRSSNAARPQCWRTAKYLLACHDGDWAAHELAAALNAWSCGYDEVEPPDMWVKFQ